MGETSVKKIGIIAIVGIFIMMMSFLSGCLSSSGSDEEGEKELIGKGNSWTYKVVDATQGNGFLKMTVTSESSTFEGNDVVKIDVEFGYDAHYDEDSEMYYDDWTGSASAYYRKADFEVVLYDYEWEIRARVDPAVGWTSNLWEGVMIYTTTGTIPDEIKTGVNYTLEENMEDESTVYSNGTLVMDDTSEDTVTKDYKVLGEKEVTVPAGTFTCFEIRVDNVDYDEYTLKYFCPELNIDVKIVEYYDDEVSFTSELESYSM